MPSYEADAVVVFGSMLTKEDRFPPHVYELIDLAVLQLMRGLVPQMVFCGNRDLMLPVGTTRECDVAEDYLRQSHPYALSRLRKECESTTVVENWLYLKTGFPELRRLLLLTTEPLLPRISWVGNWIYGDDAVLTFKSLPWPAQPPYDHFTQLRRLQDTECVFRAIGMQRGQHWRLLNEDGKSIWTELYWQHRKNCPYALARQLHHS